MNKEDKKEVELATSMLKLLGEVEIVSRCKYKLIKLFTMIDDNIIDVDDLGDKEKEGKYKILDNLLDTFICTIETRFKEEINNG